MRPGIGELKVFPSIWGHWAGGEFSCILSCATGDRSLISRTGPGDSKEDVKWLDDNLREFFASNPSKAEGK